ncbi:MAG: DUF1566 domain-containing protein [Campylobacterota bacterium]|nr:DUF1566 domain-containing protein [Campylobacterota bacterium]
MRTILLILVGLSSMLSAEFTRDANGIVTDSSTGLVWQDDAIGSTTTWENAIDRCEALSLGGHDDWRLPNLRELTSLIDNTKYDPSINMIFQNTASSYYWSSTSYASSSNYAWVVYFYSGGQYYGYKARSYYVRCVVAGQ